MRISETAAAKINLSLHVIGQRKDGYHLLDSIVGFADFGDNLTFEKADKTSLTITGPFAQSVPSDRSNLVLQAAEMMGCSVKITLEKRLPPASGIGGGSADAAATLRGMSRLFEVAIPPIDDLVALGADVPVCMSPIFQRMQGIGEVLSPIDMPPLPAVLVNPLKQVSTAKIFQALPSKSNPQIDINQKVAVWEWLRTQRNDLEPVAAAIEPRVKACLEHLSETDAEIVRMSGSGATCFALYKDQDKARQATVRISKAQPFWWIQTVTLG